MNRLRNREKLMAAGLSLSTAIALGGCATTHANSGGEILAGYSSTVVNKWYTERHTTKHGPSGYVMYLRTEDCPEGVEPTPGLGQIQQGCVEQNHEVTIADYLKYADGTSLVWNGEKGVSRVEQHRYGQQYYYATVYDLELEVKQCLERAVDNHPAGCTTGKVKTEFNTWMNTNTGDDITYAGEPGDVVR